ncbi:unnamed protein product [Larinioides sclopetarius]|uniref:CLIP domain-containing serine protease n=1 Tax=Larinioides sclopetarius TaxID=280406 RepID=A0AAV2A2W2_9ARAC
MLLIPFFIDMCVGQIVFEGYNSRSPDTICMTPDRRRGNCERWTKCETLSPKINGWNELRAYLCGFAGTEPKVCCPSSPLPNVFGPPANAPPRSTDSGATNAASSVPRTNPTGSPIPSNGKPTFLPDDCGSSIFAHNRVIGGQKSEKGSWPWMAVILRVKRNGSKRYDCGGVLVTARHVITAAHCVVKQNTNIPTDPKRLMVKVGAYDLSNENDPDAMDIGVDAVRIHEYYDLRTHTDDIAVLRLSQPVQFSNYTSPICLPYDSLRYEDLSGKSSTVTGFGLTSVNGSYSDVLMEVSFEIQDQEECRRTYARDLPITSVHLCAGTLDGSKDSCQGDSGGPLVTVGKDKRYYLVGIVSFGKKCATKGYPGVYTRITEYLDWLTPKLAD